MDAYAQKTSLIKNHHFLHPVLILLVVFTCYTNTKMDDNEARTIDEQKTLRRARLLNIAYEDTSAKEIKLYPDILTVPELYDLKVIPLTSDQYHLQFGITNTTSQSTIGNLKQRFADQQVTFAMISDMGYRELMRRYDPPKEVIYEDITINESGAAEHLAEVSKTLSSVRADDMLAYVVQQAYKLKASDIHLENQIDNVRIRFRVDGVLHPVAELNKEKYHMLIASLAVAANVSTSSPEAQTGHINKTYEMADGNSVTVNLRVETMPAVYGMDVVLRLFNLREEYMRLDALDLTDKERQIISEIISHPSGLVLMVGPTGSGKTTTLYSIINELNKPERKIITLEDPVEFYIRGITQIPVDSRSDKEGFAEKFRSVLRSDPDVVMVGEIRDQDTAKTALQSSLTGHLVLSTYHASSACAAISRLLDSIGDNPLFTSAIRLIAAQRLVRRLDDSTKQAYTPDEKTMKWTKPIIDSLPPGYEKPNLDGLKLYRAGASADNPFGYTGQFAVRELLIMTPALVQELRKPVNEITTEGLEHIAIQDGMMTIMQDAILRVIAGDTSLEEIMRVIG
jgi:type II secretory ATPase GspE/PulE/Tfp pilus assembly ATPase PilB-like protein